MIEFNVFKNRKRNALIMSYDDGTVHDIKLVKILNKYGIKGIPHI